MAESRVTVVEDTNLVEVSDDGESVLITEPGAQVLLSEGYLGPPGPPGPRGEDGAGAVPTWFSGEGPPPDVIPGATRGDHYVDTISGIIYQLQ